MSHQSALSDISDLDETLSPPSPLPPTLGWSDFETKMLQIKLVEDPNFKISCLNVAFSLVAGPQKIECYPKMRQTNKK